MCVLTSSPPQILFFLDFFHTYSAFFLKLWFRDDTYKNFWGRIELCTEWTEIKVSSWTSFRKQSDKFWQKETELNTSPLLSIDHKCLFFLYTCIQHHGNKREIQMKKKANRDSILGKTTWKTHCRFFLSKIKIQKQLACVFRNANNKKK